MATLIVNSEKELNTLMSTDGAILYDALDVVLIKYGSTTIVKKGPFVKEEDE